MGVQFRIDNFVKVEIRSLLGSIHLTIYISIHDFIFYSGMSKIRCGNERFQFALRNNCCTLGHSVSRKLICMARKNEDGDGYSCVKFRC